MESSLLVLLGLGEKLADLACNGPGSFNVSFRVSEFDTGTGYRPQLRRTLRPPAARLPAQLARRTGGSGGLLMIPKLWIPLMVSALGGALATASVVAWPSAVSAKPAAAAPAGGKALTRELRLAPDGLRWGIPLQLVAKLHDDAFDADYVDRLKAAQPGPEMSALDAELADKKALLRRTKIEFGTTPTGLDQGPLKGEYSYNNGESLAKIQLSGGTVRYYFFFGDKLWKAYDEYKLGPSSKLGTSWEDAVKSLSTLFGGAPQMLEADYSIGRSFPEAVWMTNTVHIRAINRDYQKIVAVAFADRGVQESLTKHRPNKLVDPSAMDRSVRDAINRDPKPSGPPPKTDSKAPAKK